MMFQDTPLISLKKDLRVLGIIGNGLESADIERS